MTSSLGKPKRHANDKYGTQFLIFHLPTASNARLELLEFRERHDVIRLEEVALFQAKLFQLWHILDDTREVAIVSAVARLGHDAVCERERL